MENSVLSDPDAEDRAAAEAMIGKVIGGKYKLLELKGLGGMGGVYKAANLQLGGRAVAIKLLRSSMAGAKMLQQRFLREVASLAALDSENIVKIQDFGIDPEAGVYMSMDFLQGHLLDAEIAQGPMTETRILDLAGQLCHALAHAHSSGIVHRDIKPGNIFIVRSGRQDVLKVMDFGIAHLMQTNTKSSGKPLTLQGIVFGTPHYMAPEQAAGREVDHRVDIYSVGVIMYEMATGLLPFADDGTTSGMLIKQINDQPPALRERNPAVQVSPALEAIIMRAMAKDPNDRYIDMVEMMEAIEAAQAQLGQAPVALPPPPPPAETPSPVSQLRLAAPVLPAVIQPAPAPVRRSSARRLVLPAILVLALLVVGAVAVKLALSVPAQPHRPTPAAAPAVSAPATPASPGPTPAASGASAPPSRPHAEPGVRRGRAPHRAPRRFDPVNSPNLDE